MTDATDDPRHPRRSLRRLLLRSAITLFLLPLLLVVLSNLWMQSPWGSGWLSKKIESRIGLATSIDSAGWMPGGKFWIKNLRFAQPSGLPKASEASSSSTYDLAFIEEIAIQPEWRELIRGKREFTSVKITGPTLHIPIELIASLAARQQSNASPSIASPVVIAQQAPPISAAKDAIAQEPKNTSPVTKQAPSPQQNAQASSPAIKKPTGMFYASKAQITLFHAASGRSLSECKNLECNIPFEGDQADGSITFETLSILNQPVGKNIKIPLQWKSPVLETPNLPLEIAGLFPRNPRPIGETPGPALLDRSAAKATALAISSNPVLATILCQCRGNGILAPRCWPATRPRNLERRVDRTSTKSPIAHAARTSPRFFSRPPTPHPRTIRAALGGVSCSWR